MKIRIKTNLLAGIVTGAFALAMLLVLPGQVRIPAYDSGAPSPRIIPAVALVGIALCAVALIVQSLILKREKIYEFDTKKEIPALVLIALFCLYVFLMQFMGFVLASVLIFSAILFYEGERKPRIYIFTALAAIGIFLLFKYVFNISLPSVFDFRD